MLGGRGGLEVRADLRELWMGMGWLDDGVLVCYVCNGRKIERIENRFEILCFFIALSGI